MAVVVRTRQNVSSQTFMAICGTADQIGNLVRISGPKVGQTYQVTSVDITDPQKMPSIGIIISKIGSTTCIVQKSGSASVTSVIPFIYGKLCFIGFDSRPTMTLPSPSLSPTGSVSIQTIGIATGLNSIEIVPGVNFTRLMA